MDIRISRGRLKNRRFKNVPAVHGKTNFTPAVLKQAVFDRLLSRIDPADYLFVDLFAGSGQMGMEAYSNGFDNVLLIEKDAARGAYIRKCKDAWLDETEAAGVHIYTTDFESALRKLDYHRPMVIFLDPPYGIQRGGRPLVVRLWSKFLAARLQVPFWVFIQTETKGSEKILTGLQASPWEGAGADKPQAAGIGSGNGAAQAATDWQQTDYASQTLLEFAKLS